MVVGCVCIEFYSLEFDIADWGHIFFDISDRTLINQRFVSSLKILADLPLLS